MSLATLVAAGVIKPMLLNRQEVATYFGLGLSSVRKLERDGVLKPVRVPGLDRVLFRRDDLDGLVARLVEK